MARMRTDTMDRGLAEPTLGFERDDTGLPALPRMGPAMAIIVWLGACAGLWALFAGLATVL